MNSQHKDQKGFTIIEVVLVLAIAGLIFLMVFIALPALQRNQRDTARKNDVTSVAAAVTSFAGNNRGGFPDGPELNQYVTDKSENTTSITVGIAGPRNIQPSDGAIVVTQRTTCGASTPTRQVLANGTTRQYTVVTKLEAGNGAYFCQNS